MNKAQKSLLLSNSLDAVSSRIFATCFSIIAITELGFNGTQIGALNFFGSISFLVFAVPAGVWVDRTGATASLRVSYLIKFLLLSALLFFYANGSLNFFTSALLVLALGLISIVSETAQTAATTLIENKQTSAGKLVSRMASADEAAGIVVPGAIGLTLAKIGGSIVFASSGVLAALALIFFSLSSRRINNLKIEEDSGNGKSSFFAGFHEIRSDKFLLTTIVVVAAGNIGLAIGESVESILVLRSLNLGTPFYGLIGTVAAIAGLIATVFTPKITDSIPADRIFAWGSLAQAAISFMPLLAYLNPGASRIILLAFSFLWSVVLFVTNVSGFSYLASTVSKGVLGRTAAARRALTMGCVPFAALLGGALVDFGGIVLPLILWPLITVLAVAVFVIYRKVSSREVGAE